jgi:hypothetical protein
MRECPKCKLQISEQALFCEHCGVRFVWHPDEEGTPSKAAVQSAPKGSRLGGLVTFLFSAVVLYYLWTNFGYLLNTSSSDAGSAASSQQSTHTVKYTVDGNSFDKETGIVNITMTNSSGGTEQRMVKTPWKTEFVGHTGLIVVLSGINSYENGSVSAEIYVDGVLLQKAHSAGGVASVSGVVR